jgi:TetR/AcrR family transcriptional regulator, regulator of cefoperazone and chloramphenicol sensitivity
MAGRRGGSARRAELPLDDAEKAGAPASRASEQPQSRHYRRAQRDRGAETRLRLLDAALDVFGKYGFEGATTRQIARNAGANLAAIVYHFGSKEALHRAVAEHVANHIFASAGPAIAAANEPAAIATPEAARAMLCRLIENYIEIILGAADAERWARFIVREQMQPTSAFDVIYRVMGGGIGTATRLVATALGRAEDDELRLRVFTIFGQVLIFRVAQALVLRRMGWSAIGPQQRAEIKRIVIAQIDAILNGAGQP